MLLILQLNQEIDDAEPNQNEKDDDDGNIIRSIGIGTKKIVGSKEEIEEETADDEKTENDVSDEENETSVAEESSDVEG